jgi:sugar transferase (PEP-CTERM/EpsH1 system associated)
MGTRKLRILFVTYGLPYPPDSGVKIRYFNLLKHVSQYHSVLLLTLTQFPEEVNHVSQLKPYCDMVDVVVTRSRPKWEHVPGIMRCLIAGRPLECYFFYYDEMASKIRRAVTTWDLDIVQIEHSFMAPYVEALPANGRCKKILSFHNVGFTQYRRMYYVESGAERKLRYLLDWMLMRHWEPKYAKRFDYCLVVSRPDSQMLQSANPNLTVSVIDNGVDTELYQPLVEAPDGNALLFIGTMDYLPNTDAVLYFCKEILPVIQREVPNAKLMVVGSNPPLKVRELAVRQDVVVTGRVPDVTPYYEQSRGSIVPLRAGGGTRLKILESMALGRPVVSTAIGCEGLEVADGRHILIADGPEQFAEKTVRLMTDRALYQRIVDEARQLVVARYDWGAIAGRLLGVYSELTR